MESDDITDAQKHLDAIRFRILCCLETGGWYSRSIAYDTGIHQDIIKPIVKHLRLDGFVRFMRGNQNEDGELYGSGHALTELGYKWMSEYASKHSISR